MPILRTRYNMNLTTISSFLKMWANRATSFPRSYDEITVTIDSESDSEVVEYMGLELSQYTLESIIAICETNNLYIPREEREDARRRIVSGYEHQAFSQCDFREVYENISRILRSAAEGQESIIKKIEVLAVFVAQVSVADGIFQMTLAVCALANGLFSGSITKTVVDKIVNRFFSTMELEEMEHQSASEFLDGIRSKFDFVTSIKELPIMQKLHKFLLYCMSLSMLENMGLNFDVLGFSSFEAAEAKKTHSSKLGFWHALFDALLLLAQNLAKSIELGSIIPFTQNGSTYEKWITQVYVLKRQSKCLANPTPHNFTIFQYSMDLDEALRDGKSVLLNISFTSKVEKERLRALVNDLEMMKADLVTRRSTQMERIAPFSCLLSGGSSVGKSHLMNIMHQYFAQLRGNPQGSQYKYTRNFTEEFWNGFSSAQWFIAMDDIAAQNPKLNTMDTSLSELINVVNNVTFVPNQADLADKGKTPCMAELVIATTNTTHLNAQYYFSCPLAIRRRLPYIIRVKPKNEYSKNSGLMLDPAQCRSVEGKYDDFWILSVSKVVPRFINDTNDDVGVQEERIKTFTDITDFLAWYGEQVVTHFKQQDSLVESEHKMRSVEVCGNCYYPKYRCGCEHQSLRETIYDASSRVSSMYNRTYWSVSDWWRNRRDPGLSWWNDDDWESFKFTMQAFFSIWGWTVPSSIPFFGFIYFMWWGWSKYEDCIRIYVNEERFFQFLFRRLSARYRTRLATLIMYTKLFALAGSAWALTYYASAYMNKRLTRSLRKKVLDSEFNRIRIEMAKTLATTDNFLWDNLDEETRFFYLDNAAKQIFQNCKLNFKDDDLQWAIDKEKAYMKDITDEDKDEFVAQAMLEKIGKVPKATANERENVWYNEEINVSSFDFNPSSLSWKGLPIEKVESFIKKNLLRFKFYVGNDQWLNTGALALGGHLYVCNLHSLPKEKEFLVKVLQEPLVSGITRNVEIILCRSQIYPMVTHDLAFITFKNLPPFKDITDILGTDTLDGKFLGEYLTLDKDTVLFNRNQVRKIERTTHTFHGQEIKTWKGESERLTDVGDCGSVLFVNSPMGPLILGIHSLGNVHHSVMVSPITKAMVDESLAVFNTYNVQAGVPLLGSDTCPPCVVGPLHRKSPLRWMKKGAATVHGSILGFRPKPKSRVTRTIIADECEKYGYSQKFSKPVMTGWKPWSIALEGVVNIPGCFRSDIVDHCVETFANEIIEGLGPEKLKKIFVYDLFTAVNGASGVAYVDKMKRNTSAGFPWRKSKKFFLHSIPEQEGLADPVEVNDECKQRIDDCINKYKRKERYCPIFVCHLKDNPTSFEKIEAQKTRVFSGGPMDWNLVGRMFLLAFIKCIQENQILFESAPGIIAQSDEWGKLFVYIVQHGIARIVAGDYAWFDKTMPPEIILAAFTIALLVCKAAGYSEEDLDVIRGLGVDAAYPIYDANGDLISAYGSNPSGIFFTVIVNCLGNCIYMRYVYTILSPYNSCADFKKNVSLMTYGDDNIMGVSENAEWFNHTAIQSVLASHGITYTMADKHAKSEPFIHISQASFLKRSWRWDDDVNGYMCPLEHESIERSLMTCVASKSVSPEYQMVSIIGSAVREYFFYGKVTFERKRGILMKIAEECEILDYCDRSTFPTWDDLVESRKSYNTSDSPILSKIGPQPYPDGETELELSDELSSYNTTVAYLEATCGTSGPASPCPQDFKLASKYPNEDADCGFCESCGLVLERVQGERPSLSISTQGDVVDTYLNNLENKIHSQVPIVQPSCSCFCFQSLLETDGTSEGSMPTEVREENVGFAEDLVPSVGLSASKDPIGSLEEVDIMGLKDFLSRPVQIASFVWNEADTVGTTHSYGVWSDYFSNSVIKNKLANFAYFRCDLHIKIMVNSSPFYYGAMLVHYQPLPSLTASTLITDSSMSHITNASQRPHIWIYPQDNSGGDMVLPFIYHKNWVNTLLLSVTTGLGTLNFENITTLESANGAVSTGIPITIYAWSENFSLKGPTMALTLQSRDEYGEGPVSKTASAVACALGTLRNIPIIGKYATASHIGAVAISKAASVLGFTNTPEISNTKPYKPSPVPVLASSEQGYALDKLTLDPKNELSVDPSVVGLPSEDTLNIQGLATRESYLCASTWTTSDALNTLLFQGAVTPNLQNRVIGANYEKVYMPPMCWIGNSFRAWRGDIIFRFRFICSQYHRGRVRITYDPSGDATNNISTLPNSQTACFNEVVDLTKDTSVEIRVPYMQAASWLRTDNGGPRTWFTTSATATWFHLDTFSNGQLNVRVLNALTAPVASSKIFMVVSVRAAETLEFANPQDISTKFSIYQPQSRLEYDTKEAQYVEAGPVVVAPPTRYLIYMGEVVNSLRQIIHRASISKNWSFVGSITTSQGVNQITMNRMPRWPGYDPNGSETANKNTTTGTAPYNFVTMHPLCWYSQAFVGYRGSINWTALPHVVSNTNVMQFVRASTNASVGEAFNTLATGANINALRNFWNLYEATNTASGSAMTHTTTNTGLTICTGFYSKYKFNTTNGKVNVSGAVDDSLEELIQFRCSGLTTTTVSNISLIAAGAPDWTPIFFVNVPTLYYNTDVVTPA